MTDTTKLGERIGDRTMAVALELAKQQLEKKGWKYGPKDIGKTARVILDGMEAHNG